MGNFSHRLLHIACVLLVASVSSVAQVLLTLYNFWHNNKMGILYVANKIIYGTVVAAVSFPILLAFCIMMIKLSY